MSEFAINQNNANVLSNVNLSKSALATNKKGEICAISKFNVLGRVVSLFRGYSFNDTKVREAVSKAIANLDGEVAITQDWKKINQNFSGHNWRILNKTAQDILQKKVHANEDF